MKCSWKEKANARITSHLDICQGTGLENGTKLALQYQLRQVRFLHIHHAKVCGILTFQERIDLRTVNGVNSGNSMKIKSQRILSGCHGGNVQQFRDFQMTIRFVETRCQFTGRLEMQYLLC